MLEILIKVLWLTLPAWVANSAAIDVSALPILKNYTTPVDFGRSWRGKRILGDGKTWRGLICGTIAGGICGLMQANYGTPDLPETSMALGLAMGFGALMGT